MGLGIEIFSGRSCEFSEGVEFFWGRGRDLVRVVEVISVMVKIFGWGGGGWEDREIKQISGRLR